MVRVLIPGAAIISEASSNEKNKQFCRPSELPIYTPDSPPITKVSEPSEPSIIENYFATARRGITTVAEQFRWIQRVAEENVQAGVDKADCIYKIFQ